MKKRKSIGVIMIGEEERLFINEEAERRKISRSELVEEIIREKISSEIVEKKRKKLEDNLFTQTKKESTEELQQPLSKKNNATESIYRDDKELKYILMENHVKTLLEIVENLTEWILQV